MKTVLNTTLTIAGLAIAGTLAFLYSGIYDVAATTRDSALVHWALETGREESIESRAENVVPPAQSILKDPKTLRVGFDHYQEMCVACHGAPGIEASEARVGLNPEPPLLAKIANKVDTKEMFWVIKNGIKMTGMPAWGPTHSDDKIWAIVAFVKTLPNMSAKQYKMMRKRYAADASRDDD
jgi:mono/diheme cytochrome c family protein